MIFFLTFVITTLHTTVNGLLMLLTVKPYRTRLLFLVGLHSEKKTMDTLARMGPTTVCIGQATATNVRSSYMSQVEK